MRKLNFTLGLLLGVALMACAGFQYRYYTLDLSSQKLLGQSEGDDLPITICNPQADVKAPCVVMKEDEFFKMRRDFNQMFERLKACEKSN